MKVESKPVYVTDDGYSFTTEKEALAHEANIRKREEWFKKLKVYRVNHSFDSCEGRGYYGADFIITDRSLAEVAEFCAKKYGSVWRPWYGNDEYQAWALYPQGDSSVEEVLKKEGSKPIYGHKPIKIISYCTKDYTWAGLPANVTIRDLDKE